MSKRISSLLALLAATSLLVLACQAPAPAAPAEDTGAAQPVPAEPTVVGSTASPTEAPKPTPADEPTAAVQAPSPVSETQAAEPPDPITADPNRPGFTLDGSPSLGDPAAPVVIVDFSDFQ